MILPLTVDFVNKIILHILFVYHVFSRSAAFYLFIFLLACLPLDSLYHKDVWIVMWSTIVKKDSNVTSVTRYMYISSLPPP